MPRTPGALRHAVEADAPRWAPRRPPTSHCRRHPAGAPLFPAPGLADLDRLLSGTAGAGVEANVKRLGLAMDLPASLDLSASGSSRRR